MLADLRPDSFPHHAATGPPPGVITGPLLESPASGAPRWLRRCGRSRRVRARHHRLRAEWGDGRGLPVIPTYPPRAPAGSAGGAHEPYAGTVAEGHAVGDREAVPLVGSHVRLPRRLEAHGHGQAGGVAASHVDESRSDSGALVMHRAFPHRCAGDRVQARLQRRRRTAQLLLRLPRRTRYDHAGPPDAAGPPWRSAAASQWLGRVVRARDPRGRPGDPAAQDQGKRL